MVKQQAILSEEQPRSPASLYWQMNSQTFKTGDSSGRGFYLFFFLQWVGKNLFGFDVSDGLGFQDDLGISGELGFFDRLDFNDELGISGELGGLSDLNNIDNFDGFGLQEDLGISGELGSLSDLDGSGGSTFNGNVEFDGGFGFHSGPGFLGELQVGQEADDVLGHGWWGGQMLAAGAESVLISNPVDGVGHSIHLVRVRSFGNDSGFLLFFTDLFLLAIGSVNDSVGALEAAQATEKRNQSRDTSFSFFWSSCSASWR